MLLSTFFETIYAPLRLRGKSQNTYRLYRLCVLQFSRSLGREATIADLTNENLLMHLANRKEVSAATRNKELAELKAMWRLAIQKQMHTGWPEIQKENEPKRTPRAWRHDQMTSLLQACMRAPGMVGDVPAWLFWTSFVRLAIDTGERVGALREAKWDWLDADSIHVPAEVRKGGKADKWFPLSDDTPRELRELRTYGGKGFIFAWPYCYTYFWSKYAKLVEQAGLPSGPKCSTHKLRRTHASVAYAAGLDPQDLLGHSDRRTTQRYLDPTFERSIKASDVLAAWLRNPPKPAAVNYLAALAELRHRATAD